jgi:hypothetical protein
MLKAYRPLDDIAKIFGFTQANAKSIAHKYRVDTFSNKGKTFVHVKDFYAAYTKHFNPALFDLKEKKKSIKTSQKSPEDIFKNLFSIADKKKPNRGFTSRSLL